MKLIINKKARYDYEISKTYTAGIVLEGREVKSLRAKHASLTGSFVKIINSEAFLLNAQINPYAFAKNDDYNPKRTRKLLLTKKEIADLDQATNNKGWMIIPLSIFLKGRNIKVDIGLGKGKKVHEKREAIKKRDLEREVRRDTL
ncbi:MAG: SsrA-binding protein SmpB [Patescibacteria group bacterium]